MTKRNEIIEIEAGDLVEILALADGEEKCHLHMVGTFDQTWVKDGIAKHVVLFDGEEFAYATEIKLYKKG